MVIINNFSIIENGSELIIDVETIDPNQISSILLWEMNSYKDYTLALDISYKLSNVSHEVIMVTAEELGIDSFTDLWFMEVTDNSVPDDCDCDDCSTPSQAITYNLLSYYMCSLNEFLKVKTQDCTNCSINLNKGLIVSINLLIDATVMSVELGFYSDAIDNINKLKKLCSIDNSCVNCETVACTTCGGFKQMT